MSAPFVRKVGEPAKGFVRIVHQGEKIPPWYGFAWDQYSSHAAVCLPLGLNVLARIGRTLWFELRHAGVGVHRNARDAYHQGYNRGKREREAPVIDCVREWLRAKDARLPEQDAIDHAEWRVRWALDAYARTDRHG